MRKLIITKASLAAISHELNRARQIWGRVHVATPGSKEAANEAQAREQYYQLKAQAATLLDEYQRAKAANAWRGENSIEAQEAGRYPGRHKKAVAAVNAKTLEKLKSHTAADQQEAMLLNVKKLTEQGLEKAKQDAETARRKSEELFAWPKS